MNALIRGTLLVVFAAAAAAPLWAQTADEARAKDCMQKASAELSAVSALWQAGRASGALDSAEQAKIAAMGQALAAKVPGVYGADRKAWVGNCEALRKEIAAMKAYVVQASAKSPAEIQAEQAFAKCIGLFNKELAEVQALMQDGLKRGTLDVGEGTQAVVQMQQGLAKKLAALKTTSKTSQPAACETLRQDLAATRTYVVRVTVDGCVLKAGAQCTKVALNDRTLQGLDLSNATLSEANLKNTVLLGVNLSGAKLLLADLSGARLENNNLEGITISGFSALNGTSFRGARLKGATIAANVLGKVDFAGADLSNSNLSGSTKWTNADFTGANLAGADLSGRDLRGANFTGAKGTETAKLAGANLEGAKWIGGKTCPAGSIGKCVFAPGDFSATPTGDELRLALSVMKPDRFAVMVQLNPNLRALGQWGIKEIERDPSKLVKEPYRSLVHDKWKPEDRVALGKLITAERAGQLRTVNGCTFYPGVSCAKADLRGRNLSGFDMQGMDFSNADLTGANLKGAKNVDTALFTDAKIGGLTEPRGEKCGAGSVGPTCALESAGEFLRAPLWLGRFGQEMTLEMPKPAPSSTPPSSTPPNCVYTRPVTDHSLSMLFLSGTSTNDYSGWPPSVGEAFLEALDVVFYVNLHTHVYQAYLCDWETLNYHWLTHGIRAGLQSSAEFSVRHYLERYPDLKKAFGQDYVAAVKHWLTYGKKEGRNAKP